MVRSEPAKNADGSFVNTNHGGASLTPEQINNSKLSQGATSLLSQFLSAVTRGEGWNDFVVNPKGFLDDPSKVSKYSPALGTLATSDPSSYKSSYEQYLKGTTRGSSPGTGIQYEGDSSYYRPLTANGYWYDYKNNAFKGIGDGYGTNIPSGAGAPPATTGPVDTTPQVKKPKPKGEEYVYGNKNPYLDTLLQMGQAGKNKNPRAPLGMGQYGNLDMLKNLMDR